MINGAPRASDDEDREWKGCPEDPTTRIFLVQLDLPRHHNGFLTTE